MPDSLPNRVAIGLDLDHLRSAGWWSKVGTGDEDACWPWLQSCGSHGYGQTWDGRSVRLAHRVAWSLANGPIPPGMTVDHICRVRRCCNPAHLRLLTNVANATDNGQGRKTSCPSGHPYSGANLMVTKRGSRQCRECANARRRVSHG